MFVCLVRQGRQRHHRRGLLIGARPRPPRPTVLVDLGGDAPAALGLPEPSGPGVVDWLASPTADAAALCDSRSTATDGVRSCSHGAPVGVVARRPSGAAGPSWPVAPPRRRPVVVDAGVGPAPERPPRRPRSRCSSSAPATSRCARAVRSTAAPPASCSSANRGGRSAPATWSVLGAPVVAEVPYDPAVARTSTPGCSPRGCRVPSPSRSLQGARRMIDLVAEQSPLGGLERWLARPRRQRGDGQRRQRVWVERDGRLTTSGACAPATLLAVIEHMLAPVGRRLDRAHPTVDARLADGSRLCAAIQPDRRRRTVPRHPSLRRRTTSPLEAFARPTVVDAAARRSCVRRCNVVVSGATSSGKTTLLERPGREVEPD